MTVDIIIPNFNGSHLIKKNLPEVLKSIKDYDSQIIIVDDGSKEDDRIFLRNIINELECHKSPIKLIEHKKNKGFSSAVNTGVINSNADFVVLLNSDVSPTQDFLKSPLAHLANNKDLFAVGCLDQSIENGKTVLRGVGIAKFDKGMVMHSEGDLESSRTFWVSGGSSVIRRKIYSLLGGLDEIYNPFYWEDIDLSYRAQKAGYSLYFDKNSVVKHLHEEGAIKTNFKKAKVTTIAYRNQFIFMWKNITDTTLLLNHFFYLPINFIGALRRGDKEFVNGFFLALAKLPAIIRKRFSQRKYYKVSDAEILNSFS